MCIGQGSAGRFGVGKFSFFSQSAAGAAPKTSSCRSAHQDVAQRGIPAKLDHGTASLGPANRLFELEDFGRGAGGRRQPSGSRRPWRLGSQPAEDPATDGAGASLTHRRSCAAQLPSPVGTPLLRCALPAQVAAALQQLGGCTDGEEPSAWFAGSGSEPLGVSAADLLADGLPSEAARREALAAAVPLLEAGLMRRCRLMATASGYATSDYAGLPEHLRRLAAAAAASAAAQPEAWRRALATAQEVVAALMDASRQLCSTLEQHKLKEQKVCVCCRLFLGGWHLIGRGGQPFVPSCCCCVKGTP